MRLSLGCGARLLPPPWVNIDYAPQQVPKGYTFWQRDLRDGPLVDIPRGSVELVHAEHVLDHLDLPCVISLLGECRRVLEPGGLARLVVMDMEAILDAFQEGRLDRFARWQPPEWAAYRSPYLKLGLFLLGSMAGQREYMGHWWLTDWVGMREVCEMAGFGNIRRMGFGESQSPILRLEVGDSYPDHSLYVEVIR